MWPLLPAVHLFIFSIDHFGFLAQFVGICPIASPYFIRSIFPAAAAPSLKRPSTADFWVFRLRLGTQVALGLSCFLIGRAQSSLRSDWSDSTPAGGASELSEVSCAREEVALLSVAAYLCLHSHRQPAQVLTLGGDY